MFAALLLTLAASPELTFDRPGQLVVAPGQTFDVTSAVAQPISTSLVVWVAQGRMGIERPSVYASRVEPSGNVSDPEGLLISQPFGRDPAVAWVSSMNAWVVAWEWNGQVLLRAIRADGSVHPATVTPVDLGQGRAPGLSAHGSGYFVTAESVTPTARLMTPPATTTFVIPLATTGLRYGAPVRATDISNPITLTMQSGWVEGSSLITAKVTSVSGMPTVTRTQQLSASVRLDLDALASRNDVAFAAYRLSDGGSASLEVMRLDVSTRIAIDAGTDVDFATMTPLSNGAFALTSTHADGRGRAWQVFTDGGFTGFGTVVNGASRMSVASFDLSQSMLLLWSTSHDGVVAQPANLAFTPAQQLVQLSRSPASDRYAQVASWNGGALAVWQRLTLVEAQTVAWRVFPDGGHAMAADIIDPASRFEVPAVTSVSGGIAMLTNDRLRRMDSAGLWAPALTLPRSLRSASLTSDRSGRVVVIGEQSIGVEEEAWALRSESDGGVTERLVFPQASAKPVRPRLALSRDGGAALAIINPAEEIWATRLSADLVARDDGGFRVSGITAVDPFVVSDDQDGFIIVYTDSNSIFARRVVDTSVGPASSLLSGEWDVGSVIEVPGGAAIVATSRDTADLVVVYATVNGMSVAGSVQIIVSGGSYTNGAGLAVGPGSLTWVFGRYDPDAGAATTRSITTSRGVGSVCVWGWQCSSALCMAGLCQPTPVTVDGGTSVSDAGLPDAGVLLDAGFPLDGGLPDAGALLDAGASDAGVSDAGASDAGASDAGASDAGASDAGASDAGVSDAGASDAGASDAGASDAGASDAGASDAGASDAGASDAGASDAGASDAGASDAGGGDGGLRPGDSSYRAGCDCQSGSGPWLISAALVLLSARRRRRL